MDYDAPTRTGLEKKFCTKLLVKKSPESPKTTQAISNALSFTS